MRLLLYSLLFAIPCLMRATSFTAVVSELERTKESHVFRIDPAEKKVVSDKPTAGKPIAQISKYVTKDDRHIWMGAKQLGRADDIFAQAFIGGTDVLIVRREHNALLNPLKFLIAITGHPIQVSEIWVVALVDGKEIWSERLVSKDAVYRWKVRLFE